MKIPQKNLERLSLEEERELLKFVQEKARAFYNSHKDSHPFLNYEDYLDQAFGVLEKYFHQKLATEVDILTYAQSHIDEMLSKLIRNHTGNLTNELAAKLSQILLISIDENKALIIYYINQYLLFSMRSQWRSRSHLKEYYKTSKPTDEEIADHVNLRMGKKDITAEDVAYFMEICS